MRTLSEEDELEYVPEATSQDESLGIDDRPQWMKSLQQSVRNWLAILPESIQPVKRTMENIKDPLFRCFEREVNLGVKLLKDMRGSLTEIMQVCEGQRKQTNDLRLIIDNLVKGLIPKSWNRYKVPSELTVIQWVVDLAERMKQLRNISKISNSTGARELKSMKVWLGGLFMPEAFVTASRQYVAQANQWSLEELYLKVTVADPKEQLSIDDCSFLVSGK